LELALLSSSGPLRCATVVIVATSLQRNSLIGPETGFRQEPVPVGIAIILASLESTSPDIQ
jgi:hypothetical protein